MQRIDLLRDWLGQGLVRLGQRIASPAVGPWAPPPPLPVKELRSAITEVSGSAESSRPALAAAVSRSGLPIAAIFSPASREPLTVEAAVLGRSMSLLKREAADALAALGAAHALVTSARLSQVQHLRDLVERGNAPVDALAALAADYQGWQNDQVRLFDAMAMVVRMGVPTSTALEQIDPQLHEQARAHLASLSVEYQRSLLIDQFRDTPSAPET